MRLFGASKVARLDIDQRATVAAALETFTDGIAQPESRAVAAAGIAEFAIDDQQFLTPVSRRRRCGQTAAGSKAQRLNTLVTETMQLHHPHACCRLIVMITAEQVMANRFKIGTIELT